MTTVFTNGCFDLLHLGHVRLLEWAASLGDCLIVGVNDDASVRRLKGPLRPIIGQDDRLEMLQSLRCVTKVVLFSEDTPTELIRNLRPDVLVKGPEYRGKTLAGEQYAGRVAVPDWDPLNVSTSKLIERLRHGP